MSNLETIKALGGERHFFAQWEKTYAQSLNARVNTITQRDHLSHHQGYCQRTDRLEDQLVYPTHQGGE